VQLINDVVVKTGCTKENKQTKETSWIWDSQNGGYEEFCLLRYNTM
jgi:hypothetical protein